MEVEKEVIKITFLHRNQLVAMRTNTPLNVRIVQKLTGVQLPFTNSYYCKITAVSTYVGYSVGPGDEKHALPPSVLQDFICIVVMGDKYLPHSSRKEGLEL